jgi:uncharacterized Tic20 family protein
VAAAAPQDQKLPEVLAFQIPVVVVVLVALVLVVVMGVRV